MGKFADDDDDWHSCSSPLGHPSHFGNYSCNAHPRNLPPPLCHCHCRCCSWPYHWHGRASMYPRRNGCCNQQWAHGRGVVCGPWLLDVVQKEGIDCVLVAGRVSHVALDGNKGRAVGVKSMAICIFFTNNIPIFFFSSCTISRTNIFNQHQLSVNPNHVTQRIQGCGFSIKLWFGEWWVYCFLQDIHKWTFWSHSHNQFSKTYSCPTQEEVFYSLWWNSNICEKFVHQKKSAIRMWIADCLPK